MTALQNRQRPLPIPPARLRRHALEDLSYLLDGRLPAAFTQHLRHRREDRLTEVLPAGPEVMLQDYGHGSVARDALDKLQWPA
ncbi:MAG: hypothetical protein KDM81_07250 [Verrucomicrobiae bacterium]|nr:hypothetical protein [Verrucomicrobiae bacterium]